MPTRKSSALCRERLKMDYFLLISESSRAQAGRRLPLRRRHSQIYPCSGPIVALGQVAPSPPGRRAYKLRLQFIAQIWEICYPDRLRSCANDIISEKSRRTRAWELTESMFCLRNWRVYRCEVTRSQSQAELFVKRRLCKRRGSPTLLACRSMDFRLRMNQDMDSSSSVASSFAFRRCSSCTIGFS